MSLAAAATCRPPSLLAVRNLTVRFGGILALDDLSFDILRGEILGLIGPNGAGKTTLFNCLSRLYVPAAGDILFEGQSLLRRPPHRVAGLGIGRTFQNVALFDRLSVRDNVLVGAHARSRGDVVGDALALPWVRRREDRLGRKAALLLEELDLAEVADAPAGTLPFGTRKRVELARALASDPVLLLLDEPASGLNHDEVAALGTLIRRVAAAHRLTTLLVEHHMGLVMSVSDRVVALDFGRKIAEGAPAAVRAHPEVVRAYLGGEVA